MILSRWAVNNELQNIQKTPLGLSGLLLELLKDHFTYNATQFKYNPNPVESRLIIDLHSQWDPSNCENYPGIYIKRNNWQMRAEGKSIGDYKSFAVEDDGYSYEFWVPITADYSIISIGKVYGEVELLATDTGTYLTLYQEPIRIYYDFARFEVLDISGTETLKEDKNYRYARIDLRMTFDFIWKLSLEKPLISRVTLSSGA